MCVLTAVGTVHIVFLFVCPGLKFTDIVLKIYPKICHKIILTQKL